MNIHYLKHLILLFILIMGHSTIFAQSTAYIIKGGATGGSQSWNGNQRNNSLLLRYHGAFVMESHDNIEDRFAVFGQLGYHVKGSAMRFRGGVGLQGEVYGPQTSALEFRNASFILGGKRKNDIFGSDKWYYLLGLRLDYTLSYDLQFYPGFSEGVRRWNYGVTIGGGYQKKINEHIALIFEANIHPDFSRQIYVPPARFINFFTGELELWPEQNIRNVALEISVGIRFLRKVEYLD
jgi:hypothetical protein